MSSVSVIPISAQRRFLDEVAAELAALDDAGLRRRLMILERVEGPQVWIEGRAYVNWCSNDYLGLSQHPALLEAAAQAAREAGIGARASRLLAGTTRWHAQLEEALAAWFDTEAAVVFPSGYQANLGALGAVAGRGDTVFMDRLAHASLVDAARASGAALRVFPHNDVTALERLLARPTANRGVGHGTHRRLIVTEGVFSMEGDRAPLAELAALADTHDALLYLDDAHGAFIEGARGRGSPEAAGVPIERFLYMATLGKALGCQGGFLAGPRPLIELLHSRARTFLYTTAPAVPLVAAARAALELLDVQPQHRERLASRVQQLHAQLETLGLRGAAARLALPGGASHIVPIVVGETAQAVALAEALRQHGILAPAIRPPTVPRGRARVRLSVTALHTDAHISALAAALRSWRR